MDSSVKVTAAPRARAGAAPGARRRRDYNRDATPQNAATLPEKLFQEAAKQKLSARVGRKVALKFWRVMTCTFGGMGRLSGWGAGVRPFNII